MQADLPAIRKKFAQSDEQALLCVAYADQSEYIPQVIALSREELERRGVDYAKPEVEAEVVQTLALERERKRASEGAPISALGGFGCAVAGILISLIVAAVMMSNGRKRAAQDAIVWCMCGMAVKMLLLALAALSI